MCSVGGSAAPTAAPGRGGAAQLLFRQYADKAASAAAPVVHSPGKVIGLTALGAATGELGKVAKEGEWKGEGEGGRELTRRCLYVEVPL